MSLAIPPIAGFRILDRRTPCTGSTLILPAGFEPMAEPWTLVIHGGAGAAADELASPARLRAMRAALEAGAMLLRRGQPAVDAVRGGCGPGDVSFGHC